VYCIIIGGGKVGSSLAREMLADGHECLVIEKDRTKVARINDALGEVAMLGDGCEAAVLEEAGTARAGIVIAVTGGDEDNLVACQVARKKFAVEHVIARLNNPKNAPIFHAVGIDHTVSATSAILAQDESALPTRHLVQIATLRDQTLVVTALLGDDSPAAGKTIGELLLPAGAQIVSVNSLDGGRRGHEPSAPLRAGDELLAITSQDAEPALRSALLA
jgi:trk system potassium uptake protein TrkA